MKKIILIILGILIVLGSAATAFYFYHKAKTTPSKIPWNQVEQFFLDCKISDVDQTHGTLVYLTLKDGSKFTSVEPHKDAAIDKVISAISACGDDIDLHTK